jgi:hypothetical protein
MPPNDDDDTGEEGTTPPDAPAAGALYTAGVILATLATLFVYLGLSAYLRTGETAEPTKPDPKERLAELRAKNQAVLDGDEPGNAKLIPVSRATAAVVAHATATGELPFPAPPPGQVRKKLEPPPEKKPEPRSATAPKLEPAPAPRPKK